MKKLITIVSATLLFSCFSMAQNTEPTKQNNEKVATFAGGCFWCVEEAFEQLSGVRKSSRVTLAVPKRTQPISKFLPVEPYTEAAQITIACYQLCGSIAEVLAHYGPTDTDGQFVDRGKQYHFEIFVHNEEQRRIAQASKQWLAENGPFNEPIIVPITDFTSFYKAEEYHQDYYDKNPIRYKVYTYNSGRYDFVEKRWVKPQTLTTNTSLLIPPVASFNPSNPTISHG